MFSYQAYRTGRFARCVRYRSIPCATAHLLRQRWFLAQPGQWVAVPEDTGGLGQSGWEGMLVTDAGSGHIWLEPLQSLTHSATAA